MINFLETLTKSVYFLCLQVDKLKNYNFLKNILGISNDDIP